MTSLCPRGGDHPIIKYIGSGPRPWPAPRAARGRRSASIDDALVGAVGGVEAEVLDDAFEDRVQPAGADVLGRAVDLDRRRSAMASMASAVNSSVDALGGQQGLVLADQRGAGLAEDPGEVVAGQVLQLDADREPALELGHQVRRLASDGRRRRR